MPRNNSISKYTEKKNKKKTSTHWTSLQIHGLKVLFVCLLVVLGIIYMYRKYNQIPSVQNNDITLIAEGQQLLIAAKAASASIAVEKATVQVKDLKVLYRRAQPIGKSKGTLVFLHGMHPSSMDGTADVWIEVNTLQLFAASGYLVIAPDLPGTPMSRTSKASIPQTARAQFISDFLKAMKLTPNDKLTILGASWGGSFGIPYLMEYANDLIASVQICPVVPMHYQKSVLQKNQVPTLVIHGSDDVSLGHNSYDALRFLRHLQHVVVPNVGHKVFQDKPNEFHAAVLTFLHRIYDR